MMAQQVLLLGGSCFFSSGVAGWALDAVWCCHAQDKDGSLPKSDRLLLEDDHLFGDDPLIFPPAEKKLNTLRSAAIRLEPPATVEEWCARGGSML